MKKRILTVAGGLALLAVTAHFFAKPMMAAVRAALVENVDERGRNPYIQSLSCYQLNSNVCNAFFPPVPAGMRLVVEHINLSLDSPTKFSHADLSGNGMIIENPFLQLQGPDPAGNNIYIGNEPMLIYYEAGQTPILQMNSATGSFEFMSGTVTLTGYLVNLSQ